MLKPLHASSFAGQDIGVFFPPSEQVLISSPELDIHASIGESLSADLISGSDSHSF